ncbi:uracil-DNA glycosylase [Erysipelothrix inopinata]|uniref:Uracil-DNA glycosylase n=1 Tax=Erysipelothrix inopinata TaxID=225084 RepID=A0A7G9RZV4_9FIRM|nr:uracil-DNA glycosylase [Erysipelothrix inopinata]QNN61129.1 uracil-DNA glycosylase [Erysipelothrix inopinata]
MKWSELIESEREKNYFKDLERYVSEERNEYTVYPSDDKVYQAFDYVEYEDVKVVILGQDPYHQPGQAMGLSFSVQSDQPLPKSLINIYKELKDDVGVTKDNGDLSGWAKQGVFLLNTLLTVRESEPLSHQKKGWESFTDTVIKVLGKREAPMVFILWGKKAQEKKVYIEPQHLIIESAHPSPLGAYRGFWKSKPFSKTNEFLIEKGMKPIDWSK